MKKHKPYEDLPYLGDECRFLRIRCAKIELAKELRETTFTFETGGDVRTGAASLRHRVATLKQAEDDLRGLIEARRRVSSTELGIERICREHGLGNEERLLVVAACLPALSTRMADEVFGRLFGCSYVTIEELATLLAPNTPREWHSALEFLGPKSRIVSQGILTVDCTPSDIRAFEWNESRVYPGGKTLAAVLGQVELPTVTPDNGTEH